MTQPTPSAVRTAPSTALGPYVINLCASTTPMALARPTAPELARFTFFVSRRREDGRERFRLHMGYFATRDEAEQLLSIIRDLYPAAWVGEAPGRKLAGRSGTTGQHAALPASAAVAAAPSAAPAPAAAAAVSAPVAPPPRPAAAAPATPAPTASKPASRPAAGPSAPARRPAAPATNGKAPAAPVAPAQVAAANAAAAQKVPPSNVREVIAALDGNAGEAPAARQPSAARQPPATPPQRPAAPPATRPPAARTPAAPAAQATTSAPTAPQRPAAPAPTAPAQIASAPAAAARSAGSVQTGPVTRDELSDSQVLRILETRRASAAAQGGAAPASAPAATRAPNNDIRLLSPDDTQTWRDIKSQLSRDAAVHFAVQLEWSVAPIDLEKVPGLAIFNAYTLYKIEGNRDGRRWYGLRLGFFSDAVAARQVALYVRSEFATVAVVPVSAKERGDAMQVGAIELPRPASLASPAPAEDAIQLIDDAVDAVLSRSEQPAADPEAFELSAETTPGPTEPAAPLASPAPEAAPRRGRPRSPQTLEETLEILGASQLSIDNGKGVRLDLGSAPRRGEPRNSTFSKLLDRLAEKLRN